MGSSGDQALYAIFKGAKKIVLADANIFTRSFVEFKMAAIQELSREEFLEYFKKFHVNFYTNHKIYAKISHYLSQKVQNFWDTVMIDGDPNVINNLFMNCIQEDTDWCKFYGNENEYQKLQTLLKNKKFELEFVYEDAKNFHNEFKDKFDLVLFSNIYDYAPKYDFLLGASFIYDFNLKHGGAIQLTSVYDTQNKENIISKEEFEMFFKNANPCYVKKAGLVCYNSLMIEKPFEEKTTKKAVIDHNNENVKQM